MEGRGAVRANFDDLRQAGGGHRAREPEDQRGQGPRTATPPEEWSSGDARFDGPGAEQG